MFPKALGKQTIRYQSESRTIEVMGLNRRTRIEQIRDRDLLMPQEVRQLPETDLVLLVEGQKPVRARKVRFFEMEPFKAAAAYGIAHRPDVPYVDIIEPRPVPVAAPDYGIEAAPPTSEPETVAALPNAVAPPATGPAPSPAPGSEVQMARAASPIHVDSARALNAHLQTRKRPVASVKRAIPAPTLLKPADISALQPAIQKAGDVGKVATSKGLAAVKEIGKPRRTPVREVLNAAIATEIVETETKSTDATNLST